MLYPLSYGGPATIYQREASHPTRLMSGTVSSA